jgi:ATP-dependent Lhr-like helicase
LTARPFAVVDIETTGFASRGRDRVIEIAVVRLAPDGTFLGEWSSLVNPQRDVGATHIHGLTAVDVQDAPPFADIARIVADQLEGAILTAHNLPFDRGFLEAEFDRAGLALADLPALCTLRLDRRIHQSGRRGLRECSVAAGVKNLESEGRPHRALTDAKVAARIVQQHIAKNAAHVWSEVVDVGVTRYGTYA